jgi:AcrR family transcriptional regulator
MLAALRVLICLVCSAEHPAFPRFAFETQASQQPPGFGFLDISVQNYYDCLMARPKEFDRDTALQDAVNLFCNHGYEGTSTDDLLQAMRISRQSLYDTFGDKRQLYLEALQQYVANSIADQIRALNSSTSVLTGLEAALLGFASKSGTADAPGCMGIGATCEFGVSDRDVTALIATADKTLRSSLERRIREGKASGEISSEVDPRAAAQFIKATFAGIKIAARGGASAATLREIAQMAIRSLR